MNFTTPFLPPIDLYTEKIATIWQDNCLTNNGPLVQQLEQEVADYLEISNVSYVSNGTIALQVAIKALNVTGDVITTPFSYVATSSALVWQNCKPIFIDIDPETFNIRPDKIASAITSNTSAILVTHVFGNPAEVSQLEKVPEIMVFH